MKIIFGILFGFFLAQTTIANPATTPIGLVVGVQGDVQATAPGGAPRTLKVKDAVYTLDKINTGLGARIQVLFNDDSLFSQGENSEVVLDEYSYDPEHRDNNSLCMRIIRGIARVVTGRITDINPERFKVKTSRATIGIRGCELGFNIQPHFDQIMIIRVPAGRRIIVQNNVPGRPAAVGESNITRPMWIRIREDGDTTRGALDIPMLRHLSVETTPAVAALPPASHGETPATDSDAAVTPPDNEPLPLATVDQLAQDVLTAAQETQTAWQNTDFDQTAPPTPSSPSTRPSFFRGGGLGALYTSGTAQTMNQLYYYPSASGFIADNLTSVDLNSIIMDPNGLVLDTRTLSFHNLPLARFGSTTAYDGYLESNLSPGVLLANDNLQQFVRRVDLNDPSARLTYWGYESALYGAAPPANKLINYDIDEVLYPDSRKYPTGGDVNALTLRVNTRTGTYAEYQGTTPVVFGRIEDLTFFGQYAQGVGFTGQNAANVHSPSPEGVSFAGYRLAASDQTAETGKRDYFGYASGWADPINLTTPPTRSLMSANLQTDLNADNEQRVHITLDKDAYQNNVNTAIVVSQTPATPTLGDLHLGTPQSSGFIQGEDFVARYQTASSTIELRNHQGGTDWVWGEWNGESVNPATGDKEAVQGVYTAGRTLSATEYMGLVNGAVGYSLNTPASSPGYATAFISGTFGQARIDGTATLNVSIPGGGATALWSGSFYLGTPGANHLAAQVTAAPITANGHLNGLPTSYVLNAGGTTYGSSFDASKPQGFTGSLVGPGTGAQPITGAIGSGNFVHTDGTTVTLTYGTNLAP